MAYIGPFNLLLPQGVKQNGSDVFNILDVDSGGAATFAVPLSADGSQPATYWGARTMLEEDVHDALVNMSVTQFKAYVDARAADLGRQPVGPITAFKNSIIVGEGDFWEFVTANGLKQVSISI